MHTKVKKWVLLFALLVLPFMIYTGCFKSASNNFATLAVIGQEGHTIPEFSFINQNNDIITNADYDGNIYIVNFIFTSCKGQCQAMTIRMRYLQNELKKYPNIKFLSHTIDPNYDTPEILKQYSTRNRIDESNFNFVTGDIEEIRKIAESYLLSVSQGNLDQDLHSKQFVIVDKEGRVRSGYSNYICNNCGHSTKKSKLSCSNCNEKYTYVGNPVGSYDGTKDYAIKDLIKDVKVLLAEYHQDKKATKNVE
jgi:cytochrome oxidase Cu insertion factor (SCO1/SenC/PrrC family)